MKKDIVANVNEKGVTDLQKKDGATFFTVTSEGTTGKGWVKYFKSTGHSIQFCTEDALLSGYFEVTKSKTYKIVIVKDHINKDMSKHIMKNLEEINKRNLDLLSLEAACLVWKKWEEISGKERKKLGFNEVVIMMNNLNSDGDRSRLRTFRLGRGPRSRGLAYTTP